MTAVSVVPGASAAAIQHHYDVGNAFYAQWLDPSLSYSCALWEEGDEGLHAAQINKINWHLNMAQAGGKARLLDVGCGWGAVLGRAVKGHGVGHATGLSLSQQQVQWVADRAPSNVEVRLESWTTHSAKTPYDAIISIGAFEHFARLDQTPREKVDGYRAFFCFCHENLVPGGRLSLQTITYENADRQSFSQFFAERIFPESDLPHLAEIADATKGIFEIETLRNDRDHYARTARCWLRNLRAARAVVEPLVGTETVRAYERYLALLVVGFHTGTMNLARAVMRRIESDRRGLRAVAGHDG
jgi:cyclopropane-fatty-acyl-phospholipid synthase